MQRENYQKKSDPLFSSVGPTRKKFPPFFSAAATSLASLGTRRCECLIYKSAQTPKLNNTALFCAFVVRNSYLLDKTTYSWATKFFEAFCRYESGLELEPATSQWQSRSKLLANSRLARHVAGEYLCQKPPVFCRKKARQKF